MITTIIALKLFRSLIFWSKKKNARKLFRSLILGPKKCLHSLGVWFLGQKKAYSNTACSPYKCIFQWIHYVPGLRHLLHNMWPWLNDLDINKIITNIMWQFWITLRKLKHMFYVDIKSADYPIDVSKTMYICIASLNLYQELRLNQ